MARNFCLLILFSFRLFGSDEFIVWAKFSTFNHQITYENISISSAMTLSGLKYEYLCEIESPKEKNQSTLNYLNAHKNELFECFYASGFKVQAHSIQNDKLASANTNVTMFPVRFTIDFKPNSAIISVFTN